MTAQYYQLIETGFIVYYVPKYLGTATNPDLMSRLIMGADEGHYTTKSIEFWNNGLWCSSRIHNYDNLELKSIYELRLL